MAIYKPFLWRDIPFMSAGLRTRQMNHLEWGVAEAVDGVNDINAKNPLARIAYAAIPEVLVSGAITRNVYGIPTSFPVQWPDGVGGMFTGTPSTDGTALSSYSVTYVAPGATVTYTQPPVTRDSTGTVTSRPAIVVS